GGFGLPFFITYIFLPDTSSLKQLIETGRGADISRDEDSYTKAITVDACPQAVFDAINDISGWWSENIQGQQGKPGAELFYHHNDAHLMKLKIVQQRPYDKIVWFVKDNFFNFTQDAAELRGTKIVFEIRQKGGKTQLVFTHHGLVKACECYDTCKAAWDELIGQSLYNRIVTGKGQPIPKQEAGYDAAFVENWRSAAVAGSF
ncbi:MAG: hypothetical protein J7599_24140, partial [Niabella sp.]|nr:hypothetical protein [Niabella sp.]